MRTAVPVVERTKAKISEAERARLKALAAKCRRDDPHLASIAHVGPRVGTGLESGPALLIEDRSEIALAGTPEEWQLEYRLAQLAADSDMLVLSGDRCPDFEAYLMRLLGLQRLDVLIAANPSGRPRYAMPRRCAEQGQILRHIVEAAREGGCLSIIPDVATGHVWNLAGTLARAGGVRVFVAGAPPRLSRQVNNKLWFAERVRDIFGAEAHPPSRAAFGPAALAARVRELSRARERVVIKVPDSAGSAGNLVLASRHLRDLRLAQVRKRLLRLMQLFAPNWRFPVKVEVWDSPILSSPSVQLWIPDRDEGGPIIEGVFEQIVEGEQGEFVGAVRAHLPMSWQERLACEAACLAFVLQELGYFGRCSFDAVIAGDSYDRAELHWIECNGRWGGVSIPMTFANRLGAAASEGEIVIVQRTTFAAPRRAFRDVLALCADLLFKPGQSKQGVILLTPAGFERGGGAHFMAVAKSLEQAKELAREALNRLAGG